MKRNVTFREIVLLTILLAIVLYYYLVQVPVQRDLDAIALQQADVLADMDTKMAMLTVQKNMQTELDKVNEQYSGNPPHLPDYDNADAVITELNVILSPALGYSINFEDEVSEDASYVMRRSVMLTYSTRDYTTALHILNTLAASEFENQISDLSIANDTLHNDAQDASVTVSLVMTFYEYYGGESGAGSGTT